MIINRTSLLAAQFVFILIALFSCKQPNYKNTPNPISDKSMRQIDESKIQLNPTKNLYWGDLHMHTSLSIDAFVGGTLTTCDEAYRFAKGERIDMFNQKVKIRQPLDFCAVTDHSETLGEMFTVQYPEAKGYKSITSRYLRSIFNNKTEYGVDTIKQKKLIKRFMKNADGEIKHPSFFKGYETTKSAWELCIQAAEDHYQPGKFTTFAGYEWSLGGGFTHLHRNIIFRDMMVPDFPMSSIELTNEEQLWTYLQQITDSGATVMAIPHNSNFSNGQLFTESQANGEPYDSNYAQLRQDFEPLVEVHQVKGNSEVNAKFWTNDEFADFENYGPHEIQKNNYLRYVLQQGLIHEEDLGINPFKYGMIGSTDTHNGTPGNTEENDTFISNSTIMDFIPRARRNLDWPFYEETKLHEVVNPGGLVAVWAEANTRGHIYDALKQKEVYATSGNRIQLRFFAGNGFQETYDSHEDLLKDGYNKGVPMGGDIILEDETVKPSLLIWAKKDPLCANLERIQVIKGSYVNGELKEDIYNVKLSDSRMLLPDGTVPDNGATVNMETGEWSKDKGDEEMTIVWTDEEFDPNANCFYYIRILELPTASWRLWDQIRYGMNYEVDAELVIQERAWSSPIWYSKK